MTLSRLETDPIVELRRDINDHLEAVGDRFDAVDRRFDAVDRRFDVLTGRLERVEQMVLFVARKHGWTDADEDATERKPPDLVG